MCEIIAFISERLRNVTHVFLKLNFEYNRIMASYDETYLARRPQELCLMCGRCCRVATTSTPYDELLKLQEAGDYGACEFLRVFVPYSSIEEARSVDARIVDNIINLKKIDGVYDEQKMTFYRCKYITDDNLCPIYEERPELCKHCPSTPWSIVPPDCGFEGWLFMEREKAKERVRKAKEELYELKLLRQKNSNDEEILKKIASVEHKLQTTIGLYNRYGSADW